MVIVGHQHALLGMQEPRVLGINIQDLGLNMLFCISGYLVVGSYYRCQNWKEYLKKRILRLYPNLIVCLFTTILVMSTITTADEVEYWHSAWKYFIYNIIMRPRFALAGVFENNIYPSAVNGSLWTLPIELVCYIILIPIIVLYDKIKEKYLGKIFWIIVLSVLAIFEIYKTFYNTDSLVFWDTEWINASSLFLYFMMGLCFNALNLRKYCNLQMAIISVIIWFCMPLKVQTLFVPFIIGYITLSFALVENPVFEKTIKRDICYELYLYGFPIQQLLIYCFGDKIYYKWTLWFLMIVSIVVTWIVAEGMYALENSILTIRLNIEKRK